MINLDEVLEENLTTQPNKLIEWGKYTLHNPHPDVNPNDFKTEEEITNETLKKSKQENQELLDQVYTEQNVINLVIEQGFTTEDAVMAMSVVGKDPERILDYLYGQNY